MVPGQNTLSYRPAFIQMSMWAKPNTFSSFLYTFLNIKHMLRNIWHVSVSRVLSPLWIAQSDDTWVCYHILITACLTGIMCTLTRVCIYLLCSKIIVSGINFVYFVCVFEYSLFVAIHSCWPRPCGRAERVRRSRSVMRLDRKWSFR